MLDGGEEARLGAEVRGAAKDGGEVEAEAVDVVFGDPVAQAVQHPLHDFGVGEVEGVAAAGVVDIVAVVVKPVVVAVVDAALAEEGAVDVLFGAVVVDDVEDDFDAGAVQGFDEVFEVVGAAVARVRHVVGEDVVAPVVAQAAPLQVDFVEVLTDGQEFDGGDAERFQVFNARRVRHAGEGAGDVARDGGVLAAEAFDVRFVDDGFYPRGAQRGVVFPVEVARADNDAFGGEGGVVTRVAVVMQRQFVGVAVLRQAVDGFGVGVEQEFLWVVAAAAVVFAIYPPAVALSGGQPGDEDVPDVAVFVGAHAPLAAFCVKEAEGDGGGVAAHQREVHAVMVADAGEAAAERVGAPFVAEQRRLVFHQASAPVSRARKMVASGGRVRLSECGLPWLPMSSVWTVLPPLMPLPLYWASSEFRISW